jgi:hypothetical protein
MKSFFTLGLILLWTAASFGAELSGKPDRGWRQQFREDKWAEKIDEYVWVAPPHAVAIIANFRISNTECSLDFSAERQCFIYVVRWGKPKKKGVPDVIDQAEIKYRDGALDTMEALYSGGSIALLIPPEKVRLLREGGKALISRSEMLFEFSQVPDSVIDDLLPAGKVSE